MGTDPETSLCMSLSAKPISLVERCYCRSTVSNLPRGYIRELRFIHTPNCPFQVMWVFRPAWMSDRRIESHVSTLAWNHQRGFLVIGHFSPSISTRWQAREKDSVHTHAPLSLSHACSGRKSSLFPGQKWNFQEVNQESVKKKISIFEIGLTHCADSAIWFKQSDLIRSNN